MPEPGPIAPWPEDEAGEPPEALLPREGNTLEPRPMTPRPPDGPRGEPEIPLPLPLAEGVGEGGLSSPGTRCPGTAWGSAGAECREA